ncbi:MAG: molybdopterin-guanine dinucleotide biosynthesis adapter protein [Tepidanaerobacteraceae bacterium]|nr:molybdopterin-guanine dinucleotide biosynthesis adapter protein [Tepidanaerobacteraceae bacterium]
MVFMRVVGFAGFSNSGKTTLITRIVKRLKERGVKVGVIKHTPHGFDVDESDTGRIYTAGADVVIASSEKELLRMERLEQAVSLNDILGELKDVELVLVEGYKSDCLPKIIVYGNQITPKDLKLLEDNDVKGVIMLDINKIHSIKEELKGLDIKKSENGDIRIVINGNRKIPVFDANDERIVDFIKTSNL